MNTLLSINSATQVKAQAGRILKVSVLVAGSAPGGVYDSNDKTKTTLQNQVAAIPNTVGVIDLDFQCRNGIVIVPGTGQTLAVSFM